MLINLREIIDIPGKSVSFDYEPDLGGTVGGSVVSVTAPSRAAGYVSNSAGILKFSAEVDAVFICVCARCLAEFEYPVHKRITALITEEGEDGGNPDGYFLQGDEVDLDEIIITELVLDTDERILCREDCAGLCERCGMNLNDGPCSCKADIDPRLAVLGQLLDNEEVF